jgi:hypothetical protein
MGILEVFDKFFKSFSCKESKDVLVVEEMVLRKRYEREDCYDRLLFEFNFFIFSSYLF